MATIQPSNRLTASAPRMARLLLRLEEEAFGDARECPFCVAAPLRPSEEGLSHAADCELERTLLAAGLRGPAR